MKIENSYSQTIPADFYSVCPKAVFAALAASLMLNHCAVPAGELTEALLKEWYTLHMQGIVPQCPPKSLWQMFPAADEFKKLVDETNL